MAITLINGSTSSLRFKDVKRSTVETRGTSVAESIERSVFLQPQMFDTHSQITVPMLPRQLSPRVVLRARLLFTYLQLHPLEELTLPQARKSRSTSLEHYLLYFIYDIDSDADNGTSQAQIRITNDISSADRQRLNQIFDQNASDRYGIFT